MLVLVSFLGGFGQSILLKASLALLMPSGVGSGGWKEDKETVVDSLNVPKETSLLGLPPFERLLTLYQ